MYRVLTELTDQLSGTETDEFGDFAEPISDCITDLISFVDSRDTSTYKKLIQARLGVSRTILISLKEDEYNDDDEGGNRDM